MSYDLAVRSGASELVVVDTQLHYCACMQARRQTDYAYLAAAEGTIADTIDAANSDDD